MSPVSQETQTVHRSFGLRMTNFLMAGALAAGGGYFFESILLSVGLYFCFAVLFEELSHPAPCEQSSDFVDLEDLSKAEELKEGESLPAKPPRFCWIRRDDRYYVPLQRTPGRISCAEFSLATTGQGPMGIFES